jgi:hypothetical protein
VPSHSTGVVVLGSTVPSGGLAACVTAMLKSEAAQAAARMQNELRERVDGFMIVDVWSKSGFDV